MALELLIRADRSGPEPPRNVPSDADEKKLAKIKDAGKRAIARVTALPRPELDEGVLLEPWPIAGFDITSEKLDDEHGFADTFVGRMLPLGLISFKNMRINQTSVSIGGVDKPYPRGMVPTGDELVLHTDSHGDVRYKVVEPPGIYYDDSEESGYRISHEYWCKLVSA